MQARRAYVIADGALQLGFLRGSSPWQTVLTLLAAGLVAFNLVDAVNASSPVVQVFWIALSIVGLRRMLVMRRHHGRLTPDERAFLSQHFPQLRPEQAGKLLHLGTSHEVPADMVLTRQGLPVSALAYLARGAAVMRANGEVVARLRPGALIGRKSIRTRGGWPRRMSIPTPLPGRFCCHALR